VFKDRTSPQKNVMMHNNEYSTEWAWHFCGSLQYSVNATFVSEL